MLRKEMSDCSSSPSLLATFLALWVLVRPLESVGSGLLPFPTFLKCFQVVYLILLEESQWSSSPTQCRPSCWWVLQVPLLETSVIWWALQLITGLAFTQDFLTAVTQTICWSIIFFFSSAGSSSAYLTIAEVHFLKIKLQRPWDVLCFSIV